ncbi:MAG: lamin tail domain-containing protein [Candidatus Promineifilaceae bacterium]
MKFKPFLIVFSSILLLIFITQSTSISTAADGDCVIPESGPWPPCASGGGSSTTPASTNDRSNCAPEYPTVCLPLWPDVDCSEITERDFPVMGWDRHKLDRDGDGIACETSEWDRPSSSGGSSGAGQPCPASGAWPSGCVPGGSSNSGNNTPAPSQSSGAGQPCPSTGAWPAGCVPNGGGNAAPQPQPNTNSTRIQIVTVNDRSEFVDLQNMTGSGISLDGWVLVSENGNQRCDLRGWLAAGARIRVFAQTGTAQGMQSFNCGFSRPIWNNSANDDAILLNPQGNEEHRFDS